MAVLCLPWVFLNDVIVPPCSGRMQLLLALTHGCFRYLDLPLGLLLNAKLEIAWLPRIKPRPFLLRAILTTH